MGRTPQAQNVTSNVNAAQYMQHAPTGQMMGGNVRNNPGNQTQQRVVQSGMRNNILHPHQKNSGMDPFGRVNPKARKVIESVER
jgi:hypothetical protein